jgi:transposase
MLLGVLLYAYCTGIRSARQIERRLKEDIAFRVPAGNATPDHVTIARFPAEHWPRIRTATSSSGPSGSDAAG